MTDKVEELAPVQRLCSEIQLFDLCDLDSCRYKSGRFCTNEDIVARFEAIKEEDDRAAVYEELDEDEDADTDSDFDEFDDSYEEDDE